MKDVNFLKANGVDIESSVNTLGIETYNEVLDVFLTEIIDKVNKLRDCLMTNNLKDYATYVHAIKSESQYLGFNELSKMALDHQLKSQEGNIEFITNNYVPLITEISRVIKVGRVYFGKE